MQLLLQQGSQMSRVMVEIDWCSMLKHSLQRRVVENWPVFLKEVYFRDGFSAVEMIERPPFTESRDTTGKTVNLNADKTCSDNLAIRPLGWMWTQWMSRDEGSDRRSRS